VDLARQLRSLAKKKGASEEEIDYILKKYTCSKSRFGQPPRKYRNILKDRFRLTKVVRIDHRDTGNDVSDKVFDYTSKTINKLMDEGYYDTLFQMRIQSIKDGIVEIANKIVEKENGSHYIEKLEQKFQQIQKSIKIENSHDMTIVNQLEDFISEVKSIPDEVDNRLIKEEKTLLSDAAKEIQEMTIPTGLPPPRPRN
jgi:predicted nuclease with TOPRIM domain